MTTDHHHPRGNPAAMRTRTLTAAVLLAAALAGCSSTTSPKAAPPATNTPTATTPEPTDPATDTPTPTDETPMDIGTTWEWQQGDGNTLSGSTTVLGYQQNVATDGPTPVDAFGSSSRGYVWAALDVKICNDKTSTEAAPTSSSPWTLAYDDGTQIEPSDTGYDTFPKPAFPMGDASVRAGRCLRGKIVFAVPGRQRPSLIDYAPAGLDTPKEWAVPAKS